MAATQRRHLDELAGRSHLRDADNPRRPSGGIRQSGRDDGRRARILGMPAFWAVLLLAAVALVISLLTSCGRQGGADASASPTDAADATSSPSASATASASAVDSATPEATPLVEEPEAWLIPRAAMTADGMKYGYADKDGRFVIQAQYESAAPFTTRGIAVVTSDTGEEAVIDRTGRQIVPWRLASISPMENDRILVRLFTGEDAYDYLRTEVYDLQGTLIFTHPGFLDDFAGPYAASTKEESHGYVDAVGQLAIPMAEEDLGAFVEGYAQVAMKFGEAKHYIGTDGKDATTVISDGISVFLDAEKKRFGYKKADGSILVPASLVEAEPFRNGTAIVRHTTDPDGYGGLYGILGTDGKYRIKPECSGIRRLANGLFAVGETLGGNASPSWDYMQYAMLALYDAEGNALSEYTMTDIQDAGDGLTAVCDGGRIRFLDKAGQPAADLPTITGQGILKLDNGFLTGEVDGFQVVLDVHGNTLAVLREGMDLGDGLFLSEERAEGSRYTNLTYPILTGMADTAVQDRINKALKDAMGSSGIGEPEKDPDTGLLYVETVEGGWSAWRIGNLLCAEQSAYWYALGAAHGMPSLQTLHIDLITGDTYTLSDLFTAGKQKEAMDFLSKRVTETIQLEMDEVGYQVESAEVKPEQSFRLTREGLVLYWAPYELASYAAGFRDFLIPWADLKPLMDLKGNALWQTMKLE